MRISLVRSRKRGPFRETLLARVLSELIKPKPDAKVVQWIDGTDEVILFLSVLTLGKSGMASPDYGQARAGDGWKRGCRWTSVADFKTGFWPSTKPSRTVAQGKPLPVIDCLIAATALHHDLMLVTRNASDVAATGVAILNPWV